MFVGWFLVGRKGWACSPSSPKSWWVVGRIEIGRSSFFVKVVQKLSKFVESENQKNGIETRSNKTKQKVDLQKFPKIFLVRRNQTMGTSSEEPIKECRLAGR